MRCSIYTYIHTYIYVPYIHTYIHIHTHICTHTHTHTHMAAPAAFGGSHAREWVWAAPATYTTAVATPDP